MKLDSGWISECKLLQARRYIPQAQHLYSWAGEIKRIFVVKLYHSLAATNKYVTSATVSRKTAHRLAAASEKDCEDLELSNVYVKH